MQDFLSQLAKNGVPYRATGPCQCCGAAGAGGVQECLTRANSLAERFDFRSAQAPALASLFLAVDAHALQHAEIHGRWSNHFHLLRLELVLRRGVVWTYARSPVLSQLLNAHKAAHPDEHLLAPPPGQRGTLTTAELAAVATTAELPGFVRAWATQVFDVWRDHHAGIAALATQFQQTDRFPTPIFREPAGPK